MPDQHPAEEQKPEPAEGRPVVVPHIDFDEPTGNRLVEARKGYGLTSLETREGSDEPPQADNG
jgi:hypothetical protein